MFVYIILLYIYIYIYILCIYIWRFVSTRPPREGRQGAPAGSDTADMRHDHMSTLCSIYQISDMIIRIVLEHGSWITT